MAEEEWTLTMTCPHGISIEVPVSVFTSTRNLAQIEVPECSHPTNLQKAPDPEFSVEEKWAGT